MPKLIHLTPRYRRHKGSGQAIVEAGGRVTYLGKWNTIAGRREYDRVVAEWLERGRQPLVESGDLTIAEPASRYWSCTKWRHVRHGQPTAQWFHVRSALQHLLKLDVDTLAVDFGSVELKVVREQMIQAG